MKLFHFRWAVSIATLPLLISSCSLKKSEVVGTYIRSHGAENETIELRLDGTFHQTVKYPDGRTWALDDSWEINGTVVHLGRCYEVYDFEHKAAIDPPEIRYQSTFNDEGEQLFENEIDVLPYKKVSFQK